MTDTQGESADSPAVTLRERIRSLYYGPTAKAARFGYGLLALDVITIGFFIAVSFVETGPWIVWVDVGIAIVLSIDFGLRIWIARNRIRHLFHPIPLADLVVILSLLAPTLTESFAFLRALRALRLLRSYHVLGLLKRNSKWVRQNEDVIVSVLHLAMFVFVVTAVVYVTQARVNPQISNYVDALYFTVATLTTTGFGDITLVGSGGRVIAVLIMVFGISLFLRLIQTVFRPAKVKFTCPECGLQRHDPDSVHCKHCGETLNIPTDGEI